MRDPISQDFLDGHIDRQKKGTHRNSVYKNEQGNLAN